MLLSKFEVPFFVELLGDIQVGVFQ
jgi:hypothetical protein